jgi:hypothetical protein
MADETPQEQEERLNRREERLARQHERLKDPPPKGGGGSSGGRSGGGIGAGLAGIGAFFAEHKITVVIVAVAGAIVLIGLYLQNKNSSTTAANAANTTGQAQNPAYQDVGTAMSLDQLTQQLNAIQQQLANQNTTTTTPTKPPTPWPKPWQSGNGPQPKQTGNPQPWPASSGLLGPNVRIMIVNGQYEYRSPSTGGMFRNVPLPGGTQYKPGGGGRYYYELPGTTQWKTLTSGG